MEQGRQTLIDGWKQEKICNARVFVGGCGATGSAVIDRLSRLGIGEIKAVDYDIVEEHNIVNQIYTKKDVGKPKVLALRRMAGEINKKIKFRACKKRIEELPDKEMETDCYISCFDNVAARYYMNGFAIQRNIPMIDMGIRSFIGTVRTIIPKKTACIECWPSLMPKGTLRASCSDDPIPSVYIVAAHVADLATMQLISLIHGWNIEPYLYFDLKNNVCKPIPLNINPDCKCNSGMDDSEKIEEQSLDETLKNIFQRESALNAE